MEAVESREEIRPTGLESRLGLHFRDPELLRASLTHRSYAFEHGGAPHNERLEFLGDAVLGLAVTGMIFASYPELSEGEMAKLRAGAVNTAVLAEVAREVELGSYLFLGRGEELSNGRRKPSILADAMEAVLGAVYLDRGLGEAQLLVTRLLAARIRDQVESRSLRDFKTSLQELAARSGQLLEYTLTSSGPDHAKRFRAKAFLSGDLVGVGEGRSKKEAEQAAADQALAGLAGEG
ncbi:MAG: ribonuclease III [Actinomycetota bacterium]